VVAGDERGANGSAAASPTVPAGEEQSTGEVAEPPGTMPAEAFSNVGGP
jgi:hypothetical protein